MNEALLAQVRRKLNITWQDTDTDNRVLDIVNQALATMTYKLGIVDEEFDFSVAGIENMLLLAYCLYLYNHCENEFDDNYRESIMQARAIHEVTQYGAD